MRPFAAGRAGPAAPADDTTSPEHTAVVGVLVDPIGGTTITVGLRPPHITLTAGPNRTGTDFGLLATLSPPPGGGIDLIPGEARMWAAVLTAVSAPGATAGPVWGDEGAAWLAVTLTRAAFLLDPDGHDDPDSRYDDEGDL